MNDEIMNEECNHVWVSNSGKGGEPEFKVNLQLSTAPLMHVMCEKCGARTWMTEGQWNGFDA